MSTPIRTAVIGFGLAGRVFHCPFVHAVAALELSAIVVKSPDRRAAAMAEYPSARVVPTVEEVLADPSIQLIVVGAPNEAHFSLAEAALKAGKHVVVDKPLTTTSADARTLISLAAAQGKILAPFHNRRYDNDFLTLKKLQTEGTLGRIVEVIAHFDRFRPLVRPNTWKEAGKVNGLPFDLGPHLVDQAVALFGAPARISATIATDRDITDIDDFFSITLEYDLKIPEGNGVEAGVGAGVNRTVLYHCRASMLAADPNPRFRVHGTHGSWTKQGLDPQEAALLKGARPPQQGSQEPWLPEPESAWGTLALATKMSEPVEIDRTPYPSVTGDYRLFYANVAEAINNTAPLAIPAEDAFKVIRLLELAYESSTHRRTLDVTF